MKRATRWIAPLAVLACMATASFAQEAPVPVGRASIASVDALTKLATELGITDFNVKAQIEMMTGLKDFLATDKPLGMVYLAGGDLPAAPPLGPSAMAILLPALPGQATTENLTAGGATPVPETPEVVRMTRGMFARRVANHLLLSDSSAKALTLVKENPFDADYKQEGALGVATVDVAALRRVAPMMFGAAPAGGPPPTGVASLAATQLSKVERATFSLTQDASSLHVRTWLSPFSAPAAKALPRPVFPKSLMQVHIVYPDATWAAWGEGIVESMFTGAPEQAAKAKDPIKRAVKILAGGEGVSIAVAEKDRKPIFYVVSQLREDADFAAEVKTFVDAVKDAMAPMTFEVSTYDAAGKTATRITVTDGMQKTYIDAIQDGRRVSLSAAMDEGKYVADLVAGGVSGESSLLCAGVIDIGGIYAQMGAMMMPPGATATGPTPFQGQMIAWSAQVTDQFMYVDVTVPKSTAKEVVKFFHSTQPAPGMMAPGGMEPGGMPPGGMQPGGMPPGGMQPMQPMQPGGLQPGGGQPGGMQPGGAPPATLPAGGG